MDNIKIRKATLEDANALCRLSRDELGYDYPLEKTQNRLQAVLHKEGHCIWVAEQNGQVVGYVHASNYDLLFGGPLKNIMGIAVSHEHKRKGIGKKLLAAVETWAKEDGCLGVRLTSGSGRVEAHAFYHSCGYAKNKEQFSFSKNV